MVQSGFALRLKAPVAISDETILELKECGISHPGVSGMNFVKIL